MSEIPELVLDILPGVGTTLRVAVQASGLAPIDDELERSMPSFPPADLDLLRSGSATEPVAEGLARQVTSWLLQSDLRGHLGTAFNAATAPFRIVIRPDRDLLAELAEVPFELLEFNEEPLVLLPSVRAIVHMQKRSRLLPPPAMPSGWPLRVLLVRSNPADLGGKVPPIFPLRDRILAIAGARRLGDAVDVTVLSSEPGGSGPVTYDALRAALDDRSYGVLVYLGHGDLEDKGMEGLAPTGVLQFELESGPYATPVRGAELRREMQRHPVPVVVLAGCLTAASDAPPPRRLPQWMRGSQSVAEALVYGDAGVQCAVGMRYRLETTDADRFLAAFFASLIQRDPGDVEQAVRRGRDELSAHSPYPSSWSAPAIFRAAGTEPMFAWMRRLPEMIDPLDEIEQAQRELGWKALSSLPGSLPAESRAFPSLIVGRAESSFVERWTKRGVAVLWPAQVEVRAGELARVGVVQQSALRVSCLEGRLTFPSALAARGGARVAPALAPAGFQAFFAMDQPGAAQFILRSLSGAPAEIPAGPLLEIDLALPATTPAVYPLSVEGLKSDPPAPLRGWSNAVVLSPP